MKLYSVGTMGFIATVAAVVANIEISQKFNITNPYLFWGGQLIFALMFLVIALYILSHWDYKSPISKTRFLMSVLISLRKVISNEERKKRTKRLIEGEAILETFIYGAEEIFNEEIKRLLQIRNNLNKNLY